MAKWQNHISGKRYQKRLNLDDLAIKKKLNANHYSNYTLYS
jgi:hypothetical protein